MTLLAALCYVRWSRRLAWRRTALGGAILLVFVSLLFYELWLTGFVLFWGPELFLLRQTKALVIQGQVRAWFRDAVASLRGAWLMLLPYALRAAWFTFGYNGMLHRPRLDIARIPRVFASIHVHFLQVIVELPWRSAVTIGWAIVGAVLVVVSLLLAILLLARWTMSRKADETRSLFEPSGDPRLFDSLFLAWCIFLASRLVVVLQGGVALHTRHSYGASLDLSLAAAVLLTALAGRLPSTWMRGLIGATAIATICFLTVTCAGIAAIPR